MKLLIITQKIDRDDPVLGFFHEWVSEFAVHCESVTAIGLSVGAHDLPKNVLVFSLGKELGGSRLTYLWNFYRLIMAKRAEYDAVFVHMNPEYVILGGILWKLMGKKIGLWYTHKHVDGRLRVATHGADVIFTASPESFRLKSDKLHIVGHGINVARFGAVAHKPDERFRILSIGRLSETKGYGILVDALEMLKKKGIGPKVTLIGGPLTEADEAYRVLLEREIARRDLSTNIEFVKPLPNTLIPDYLARADLFVNMSKTGSLDKAVLEAMAAGVPVLTSNEGLRTTLAGFEKTCMFKEGDAGDLVAHISDFVDMPEGERNALGARLRDVVARSHDIKKLIPRILDRYAPIEASRS